MAADIEYLIRYDRPANRFIFIVGDGAAIGTATANTLGVPATGAWYCIFCWHDPVADTINIQVNDGGIDSVAWATGVQDGASEFTLSRLGDCVAQYADAVVDEVAMWKRIPTATERTAYYNGGNGIGYDDLGETTRTGGIGEFVAGTIIESNGTQVTREYDADRRAGGIIKAVAELGDSTGLTWVAYMGLNRTFYFQPSAPPFEETL